jgi:peptidoglycan/LPS O-acetylase OafA/YrhL
VDFVPDTSPLDEPLASPQQLPTFHVGPRLSAKLTTVTLVAICAVIVLHSGNLNSRFLTGHFRGKAPEAPAVAVAVEWLFSNALVRWAVPLLFALSGFLFARDLVPSVRSFARKYRSRARTVLAPFLLWSAIGIVLLALEGWSPLPGRLTDTAVARSLAHFDVLERWLRHPVTYPLWFLQALLLCILVSPALYVLVDRLGYVGLAPLVALWALTRDGHGNYFDPLALTFFALGMVVALRLRAGRWVPFTSAKDGGRRLATALPPLFVAASVAYGATLRESDASWAAVLYEGIMCLGVAAVWLGYDVYLRRWESSRVVTTLAPLAFFIFCAQEPALHWYKRLFLVLTGGSRAGAGAVLVSYVLTPVATLVTVALLGAALRAAIPPVYGLLTGGRGAPRSAAARSAPR